MSVHSAYFFFLKSNVSMRIFFWKWSPWSGLLQQNVHSQVRRRAKPQSGFSEKASGLSPLSCREACPCDTAFPLGLLFSCWNSQGKNTRLPWKWLQVVWKYYQWALSIFFFNLVEKRNWFSLPVWLICFLCIEALVGLRLLSDGFSGSAGSLSFLSRLRYKACNQSRRENP